jgi:signal peptidase II
MRSSLLALFVFALDRWSKHLVETGMSPFETRTVIPGFFDIVRSNNPGVAFGIFSDSSSSYRAVLLLSFSVIALLLLAWMLWRNRSTDAYSNTAVALIFGGAAGNVYDRFRAGSVTDFLDFYSGSHHWYTFNIADTAISIGAGLLLLGMLRRSAAERKAHT